MDIKIRPMRGQEREYIYIQPQQIAMQTSDTGYLRGDMGSSGIEALYAHSICAMQGQKML